MKSGNKFQMNSTSKWTNKNYLFAGSDAATINITRFCTLFISCKAPEINPYDYLKCVLDEFPKALTTEFAEFIQ